MQPIPPPDDVHTLIEMITIYMREHYLAQDPSTLKEEADSNVERLRKQAAGRVFTHPSSREEALKWIENYYEEKRMWHSIVGLDLPANIHRTLTDKKGEA